MLSSLPIIDRYIRERVLLAMLVVISLVLSIDIVFALVDELGDTENAYNAWEAMRYVAMTLPSRIFQLLPFTALGGSLIGLGVMASHNELIIIQSAGVSTWRLVWAVLKPAIFVMIAGLILGEYIAPPLQQAAQSSKAILSSGVENIDAGSGSWRKLGNEYIHVNAIAPGGETLFGVSRYKLSSLSDSTALESASFAQSASYVAQEEGGYWLLKNVVESRFEPAFVRTSESDSEEWHVDLSPQMLAVMLVAPDRQSISGLYSFAQFFENQGMNADCLGLQLKKKYSSLNNQFNLLTI